MGLNSSLKLVAKQGAPRDGNVKKLWERDCEKLLKANQTIGGQCSSHNTEEERMGGGKDTQNKTDV